MSSIKPAEAPSSPSAASRTTVPVGIRRRRCFRLLSACGSWSRPGSSRVFAPSDIPPKTTVAATHCAQTGIPACRAADPMNPPHTAPIDHQPWKLLRIGRP